MAHARAGLVVLLTLLVLGTALAGCTKPPANDPDDGSGPGVEADPEARAQAAGEAPFWFPGLTFEYLVHHEGMDTPGTLALTVLPGHDPYRLHAHGDPDAIRWSLYWGLPPIGPFTHDHDPIHDGAPLGWFRFPLAPGTTWQGTDLDGATLAFRAEPTTVTLHGDPTAPAYEVVGTVDGTPRLGYTYTAEAFWFTRAWRDGNGDGTPDAEATLERITVDTEKRDEPPRDAARLVDLEATGPPQEGAGDAPPLFEPIGHESFDVPEDAEEVLVYHDYDGGPGVYQILVTFADGSRAESTWVSDGSEPRHLLVAAHEAPPGTAEAVILAIAPGGAARVTLLALLPAD